MLNQIDYSALAQACNDLRIGIPDDINICVRPDLALITEEQLRFYHHILMEIEVVSGTLVSPSERRFPIVSGIPDMCPQEAAEEAN